MDVGINAWFWGSPTTGSGQYTRRIVEAIARVDPDVELTLVAPDGRGVRAERFVSLDRAITGSNEGRSANRLTKVWFEQVAFPHACRTLGVDLAHVPYWASPLRSTVPVVVTIHDLIPLLLPAYRGNALVRLYTALVARTAQRAELVLTDSHASKRDVVKHLGLPEEKVRVVYLAADERYSPEAPAQDSVIRRRYDLPESYVLYLGGFDVRKNLWSVFAAYAEVGPIEQRPPLAIAGRLPREDTAFTPDPRRLAREVGVRVEDVHFVGFVAEEDKPAVYRGASVFLFPSRYEGFGLPPLEALACGTPVVASDRASLPEVVGEAGILAAPDDVERLAEGLRAIVTDEDLRRELHERALIQAAGFSWRRAAEETLGAYEAVAASQA